MPNNPIDHFTVSKDDFRFIGERLQRPKCILAEKDGTLWSADARGGVVRIDADGTQTGPVFTDRSARYAQTTSQSWLMADLGR